MYHCINNAIATQDVKMSIDNYDFSLKCDNTWAGAMQLGASTVGAAGLLMATIYWKDIYQIQDFISYFNFKTSIIYAFYLL